MKNFHFCVVPHVELFTVFKGFISNANDETYTKYLFEYLTYI